MPSLFYKAFLIFLSQAAKKHIFFIMDMWSDQNYCFYLAIIAYWITTLKGTTVLHLKTVLIAFYHFYEHYNGKLIIQIVLHLFNRAKIIAKMNAFLL